MAGTYKTTQGDVWDLISYKVYGDEGFMDTLINANPAHRHTVMFGAGVELAVPEMPSASPVSSLPPWRNK
ncbi:MAG: tail protein X [Clostridiales bacterium]|jgi:phage tail protein X|nr:tail protein X [Clostridiales bacterium]